MAKQYTMRFGYMTAKTKYPSVFEVEKGGYLIRGRAQNLAKKQVVIFKYLEGATLLEAVRYLDEQKEAVRKGSAQRPSMLFSEFAASLLDRKIQRGDIKSQAGVDKWKHTLTHWIGGTEIGSSYIQGFGDYPVEELRAVHVEHWKDQIAPFIKRSKADKEGYAPSTLNSWLRILRVISRAIAREYETRDFMLGVDNFDASTWETYTEEDPNSLHPNDVPKFLDLLKERWPQHYAMAVLGFITGLRPSTLRPLRRKGELVDVLFDEGRLLVRLSETRGKVMTKTKTGIRYSIHLPPDVVEILRWHEGQLNDAQRVSDLLFPSTDGGFRAGSALTKPFADVCDVMGIPRVTAKAMRRTFNDLARAAQVEGLVTKSISGHQTDQMVGWYSTIRPDEQRESLGRVLLRAIPGGQVDRGVDSEQSESGQKKRKSA